jgi:mannitol-1-/sugar-/sorbitol-6-/2-deoxyglucose-6-phosphatase
MPIEAVIFDMDGVLVDSEPYWLKSREEFSQSIGKTWTDESQRLCMGRSTIEWAEVMQERLELDMTLDDIMADIKARVISHYEQHLPLLPGAVEAVHTAASGFRVALASGSPTEIIHSVTQLTGLDQVFEVMVFGDNIKRGKPAPDIYLETARLLGIPPQNCVGIEDSGNGVRAVKAAGMYAIAAPSPAFPLPDEIIAMADLTLSSLEGFSVEMVKALEKA